MCDVHEVAKTKYFKTNCLKIIARQPRQYLINLITSECQ